MLIGNYGLPRICICHPREGGDPLANHQLLKRIDSRLRWSDKLRSSSEAIAHNKLAFTLIEISIVLVIIGLIVGGVLVGKDLIEVARTRSQISEWEKASAAVNTFKLKYNCLPGDCPNATNFFTGVANGNGNGFTQPFHGSGLSSEQMGLIQQLNLSGFLEARGQATGWGSDNLEDVGPIIPEMKTQKRRAWWIGEPTPTNPASSCFNGGNGSTGPYVQQGRHYFITGAVLGQYNEIREHLYYPPYNGTAVYGDGAMSTSQAFQIDSKIDDGKPQTGIMVSTLTRTYPCYHQQIEIPSVGYCVDASGNYDLSYTGTAPCSPMVEAGF